MTLYGHGYKLNFLHTFLLVFVSASPYGVCRQWAQLGEFWPTASCHMRLAFFYKQNGKSKK